MADVEHASRLLARRSKVLDGANRVSESQLNEYDDDHETNKARRFKAYKVLNAATAAVDLVASPQVIDAAALLQSRTHHPHLLPGRVEAESSFIDVARAEFGHPPVGDLNGRVYEDLIEWDDPRSGIAPA